jgi:predicted RNA-binding protein YlxR (DUF448 family)
MEDLSEHQCRLDPDVDFSWEESDARGIYLCRVCDKCEQAKLSKYRPEVLSNSNYHCDELVEEPL